MKKQKGITLIALIITIIVMLILVGVSVSVALDGGLFKTAKEAAEKTKFATQVEAGSRYDYEIAKATGKFTGTYNKYVMQKEYEKKKNEGSFTGTYNEFVISKHKLGTAKNTENYGRKVVGYKAKGAGLDTLVWRLFYQDDRNVYLISETADRGLLPQNSISFAPYNHGER